MQFERGIDDRPIYIERTEEKTFFAILEFRELQNKNLPLNFLSQKEIPGYNNFPARRYSTTLDIETTVEATSAGVFRTIFRASGGMTGA